MVSTRRRLAAAILALTLLAIPGTAQAAVSPRLATATLRDAAGATVGWALFTQGARGVHVVVVATGMTPGLHGLHIHAIGSCVSPDFASAGGHFNPLGVPHGAHAGDLPDLIVTPGGIGHMITTSAGFRLLPGPLSIFDGDGAALIIHANPDDHVTNPSGNSGPRIACGAIQPVG